MERAERQRVWGHTNKFERNRLRAGLYLCIADLFIGAAAVLMILVVLAVRTDVARYPRNIDVLIGCELGADGAWKITAETGAVSQTYSIEEWVSHVEIRGLISRVGVLTPQHALGCYAQVESVVRVHNRQLTTRSGEGGVIALVFLPEFPNE